MTLTTTEPSANETPPETEVEAPTSSSGPEARIRQLSSKQRVWWCLLVAGSAGLAAVLGLSETLPEGPSFVLFLLLSLFADFVVRFVWAASRRRRQLKRLEENLQRRLWESLAHSTRGADHSTLIELDGEFAQCDLKGVWEEFRESLHERAPDEVEIESGNGPWYQTVPSELFLTRTAVVDRPLSADYFKHLPGILTGLGIIATFLGLIGGLAGFEFASDTDAVRSTVGELIDAVQEAFFVSAIAIGLAMLVTFVEKQFLEDLYQRLHRVQGAVNSLFHGVQQEEYLRRIGVRAAESATELKNLRAGLVDDLTELFAELTDTIERASAAASAQIGQQLAEPVATLRQAIDQTLNQQQTAVHQLLDSTLEEFARRLEEAVGRHLVYAAGKLSEAISELKAVLDAAPRELEQVIGQVKDVLRGIELAAEPMREHAQRLAAASDQLTNAVETSAETWDYASQQFRRTTLAFDEVSARLAPAAQHVAEASSGLDVSATALGSAATSLGETGAVIDHLRGTIGELAGTLESETQQRQALAAAVDHAASQLRSAQQSVDGFLADLQVALSDALKEFGTGITTTSDRTYEEFSGHLSKAVGLLGSAIDEVRALVDGLSAVVDHQLETATRALPASTEPAGGGADREAS